MEKLYSNSSKYSTKKNLINNIRNIIRFDILLWIIVMFIGPIMGYIYYMKKLIIIVVLTFFATYSTLIYLFFKQTINTNINVLNTDNNTKEKTITKNNKNNNNNGDNKSIEEIISDLICLFICFISTILLMIISLIYFLISTNKALGYATYPEICVSIDSTLNMFIICILYRFDYKPKWYKNFIKMLSNNTRYHQK